MKKPVFLIVLDGWGQSPSFEGNAIAQAKTPHIDSFCRHYPQILLQASGISVGLPWGEVGNSEVGHMMLGAGRVIYQSLPRITLSIQDGTFFKNPALVEAAENTQKNGGALHIMGLCSSGGVHSSMDHLFALLELAKNSKLEKVFIHVFTDGRDAPQKASLQIIEDIGARTKEFGCGKIASVCGRYFAMDRNDNWNRTEKAYDLLTLGTGAVEKSAAEAVKKSYAKNITDEFIEPVIISEDGNNLPTIGEKDSVIFFNFREDRARQLSKAFALPTFNKFERKKYFPDIDFVCMTQYEDNFPADVAFPPIAIKNCLGEVLSLNGIAQLRIAETEKYAHVTYFFDGGREDAYPLEDRVLVPSQTVSTYDKAPEMSAAVITDRVLKELGRGKHAFYLINFANADMVGHTGKLKASIAAVETIDECLGKLVPEVLKIGGSLLITADHGNAEEIINMRTEEPDTEHSIFPVPLWYITPANQRQKTEAQIMADRNNVCGILSDIAPTILTLFETKIPPEMTGQNLLPLLK